MSCRLDGKRFNGGHRRAISTPPVRISSTGLLRGRGRPPLEDAESGTMSLPIEVAAFPGPDLLEQMGIRIESRLT